ncbi:DUF6233 domain-containing protein [Streptomyces lasalocidi]
MIEYGLNRDPLPTAVHTGECTMAGKRSKATDSDTIRRAIAAERESLHVLLSRIRSWGSSTECEWLPAWGGATTMTMQAARQYPICGTSH